MMFTRDEIIGEHEMAAGYHWAILDYLEEHPKEHTMICLIYGDEEWHKWWYELHADTALLIWRNGFIVDAATYEGKADLRINHFE